MRDSVDSIFHLTPVRVNHLVEQCVELTRWLLNPTDREGFIPAGATLAGADICLKAGALGGGQDSTQDLGNGGAVWD